jgi:hypothetical protein
VAWAARASPFTHHQRATALQHRRRLDQWPTPGAPGATGQVGAASAARQLADRGMVGWP